jgi:hypothetical protein
MKRTVLVGAAILWTACGTPPSGAPTAPTASPWSFPLAGQLNCRLPVVTGGTFDPRAVTASGAGGQGANVGFFQFPNGPAINDSSELIRYDPIRDRFLTLRQPVLESTTQVASWDAVQSRWVPVDAGLVSPDATVYAWTEYPSPQLPHSRVHVTSIADGRDSVVITSGSAGDSRVNLGVVRYDHGALLLTSLAASEGGWEVANRGLWRLDLDAAKLTQVLTRTVSWNLLSPHAAWSTDVDPAGGPPVAAPSPDTGSMPNRLVRHDLASATTQTWITRPGKIVTLLGVDLLDRPLVRIQPADATEIDYLTAPGQSTIVYRSSSAPTYGPSDDLNATGAGYALRQVQTDSHGIWVAHDHGLPLKHSLLLFSPVIVGLETLPSLGNFDPIHRWYPAGPCTE